MSYEPTTWANGDLITAQKINRLEQQVAALSNFGGFDVIIGCDSDDTYFSSEANYTLIAGNFSAVFNKVSNGLPVLGAIVQIVIDGTAYTSTLVSSNLSVYCDNTQAETPMIKIHSGKMASGWDIGWTTSGISIVSWDD